MQAGKKLDEMVALHVFEWEEDEGGWKDPRSGKSTAVKSFSKDISAAWEVVERICSSGYRLQLDGSRLWLARFYKSAAHTLETKAVSVTGRSAAEAICLSALAIRGAYQPKT